MPSSDSEQLSAVQATSVTGDALTATISSDTYTATYGENKSHRLGYGTIGEEILGGEAVGTNLTSVGVSINAAQTGITVSTSPTITHATVVLDTAITAATDAVAPTVGAVTDLTSSETTTSTDTVAPTVGAVTDLISSETTTTSERLRHTEGFESGSLNDDWTTVETLTTATDRVLTGTYAGRNDTTPPDNLIARYRPTELIGGANVSSYEVYYQETSSQTGHAFNLYDSSGTRILSFGSENPQFWIRDGDGEKYQPKDTSSVDAYDTWLRVSIQFDWSDGTYYLEFARADGSISEFVEGNLIQNTNLGYVDLAQNIPGTSRGGSANDLWIDDISLDTHTDIVGSLRTVTPETDLTAMPTPTPSTIGTASASSITATTDTAGTPGGAATQQTASPTTAVTATGVRPSGTASGATASASIGLNAPTDLTATYDRDDKIDLSWTDNSGSEDNYRIQIDRDGTGFVTAANPGTVGANSTSASVYPDNSGGGSIDYDASVGADSSFQFRIRAESAAVDSEWTAATGTVYTTPVPVHNPGVSRPNVNTVEITFDVISNIPDRCIVRYREDTGSGYGSWDWFDTIHSGEEDSGSIDTTGSTVTRSYDVGTTYQNGTLQKDARYQFKLQMRNPDAMDAEGVIADYGNQGNVYFKDDFSSGDASAWNVNSISTGGVTATLDSVYTAGDNTRDPEVGGYAVEMGDAGWLEAHMGDLSNETDVIIRARMQLASNDSTAEDGQIQFYDGSGWNDIESRGWAYDGQGWFTVTAEVPDSYLNSDSRARIGRDEGGGIDMVAFDEVIVTDVLHEYTEPTAPSALSIDNSTEGELSYSFTDNMAIQSASRPFGDLYLDGNLVDKIAGTTGTHTGINDGEEYEIRTRNSPEQHRHGEKSQYWGVSGPTQLKLTRLPGPTEFAVSGATESQIDLTWNDLANNETGQTLYYTSGERPAMDFSDDNIVIPSETMDGLSDFTISYWAKGGETGTYIFSVAKEGTDNVFLTESEGRDEWTHYTYTKENGTGTQYRDGVPGNYDFIWGDNTDDPVVADGIVLGQDQDSVLGGYDSSQAFSGQLRGVRIYNRALSDAEVKSVYGTEQVPDGIIGYWPLDVVNSGTTPDEGTYDYDATVNGATLTKTYSSTTDLSANTENYSDTALDTADTHQYRLTAYTEHASSSSRITGAGFPDGVVEDATGTPDTAGATTSKTDPSQIASASGAQITATPSTATNDGKTRRAAMTPTVGPVSLTPTTTKASSQTTSVTSSGMALTAVGATESARVTTGTPGWSFNWFDTTEIYNNQGHPQNEAELDEFFVESRSDVVHGGSGIPIDVPHFGEDGYANPNELPGDGFSYRAKGYLSVPETGTYEFTTNSDDASDVFIDGTRVASWYDGHGTGSSYSSTHSDGTIDLDAGLHEMTVRMEEGGGGEAVMVGWITPSTTSYATIPDQHFHVATDTATTDPSSLSPSATAPVTATGVTDTNATPTATGGLVVGATASATTSRTDAATLQTSTAGPVTASAYTERTSGSTLATGTGSSVTVDPVTESANGALSSSQTVTVGSSDTTSARTTIPGFLTGRIELDGTINEGVVQRIDFPETFDQPAVVSVVMTTNGTEAVAARHRNVTSDGFDVFMQEPDAGSHPREEVGFIAVDAARNLPFGIQAGTTTVSGRRDYNTISFDEVYASRPAVVHTLQTNNNTGFSVSAQTNVDTDSINLGQDTLETGDAVADEEAGWIALPTGSIDATVPIECGYTANTVTDAPHTVTTDTTFSEPPTFVVSTNTLDGSDGLYMRGDNSATWTTTDISFYAEEDQVSDDEQGHADEVASWIAIEPTRDTMTTSTGTSVIRNGESITVVAQTDTVTATDVVSTPETTVAAPSATAGASATTVSGPPHVTPDVTVESASSSGTTATGVTSTNDAPVTVETATTPTLSNGTDLTLTAGVSPSTAGAGPVRAHLGETWWDYLEEWDESDSTNVDFETNPENPRLADGETSGTLAGTVQPD